MNDPKSDIPADAVTGSECKTGVPRIEVTPEMLEAGAAELVGFDWIDGDDRDAAGRVYRAMIASSRTSGTAG